jgi:hypothetical protein
MSISSTRDRRSLDYGPAPDEAVRDEREGSDAEVEERKVETLPPSSSPRRTRYRQQGRKSTQKVRPWSQLPGVVAYLVIDPNGQLTDKWGDPGAEGIAKADAFRLRASSGSLGGSFALEPAGDDLRLLSVSRADGWFVHVWLLSDANVTGVLTIIGG